MTDSRESHTQWRNGAVRTSVPVGAMAQILSLLKEHEHFPIQKNARRRSPKLSDWLSCVSSKTYFKLLQE